MTSTKEQFDAVIKQCRSVYEGKLKDYGASWRIMRPESITDQILIKAKRIRCIEIKKESKIDEGVVSEYVGIVNYCTIGLIQLERGFVDAVDLSSKAALDLYDKHINAAKELMYVKNHDYDEAWRLMRVSSYTDMILTKLNRVKEIENNDGAVFVSEGVDSNYMDMINYALFGLIKLTIK